MPVRILSVIRSLPVLLLLCTGSLAAADVDFNRDVRPILSNKCFHCHGPDESTREADLRLDLEESAKADRDGTIAVKAGDSANSELIHRILSTDESDVMPPHETNKPLTKQEITILQQWVAQGAKWSQQWAFVKPVRHEPPGVENKDWPINWIDQFILERLQREELTPAIDADRSTLLRRIHFDLTGLPPTTDVAEKFAANTSGDAWETVVDSLLESPAYGERMAMYWLDLVRYADTVGYHGDQDQNISAYRDWVIGAFNDGMPFDRFTREQLAGDLIDNPTLQQRVATGYNRLLQTTHEGGLQEKEYRAIYAADRVRNVSAVWMGATVGCAQCHDHKFDPYTAKDFYSLAAFFDDVDDEKHFKNGTNSLPTRREPEIELPTTAQQTALKALESKLADLNQAAAEKGLGKNESKARTGKVKQAQAELKTLRTQIPRSMITVALKQPRVTRVLERGDWQDDSGDIVPPAVPHFMASLAANDRRLNRLDLANWFVDSEHGAGLLTARVMVNRLWYLFFGNGLAADLDDFGGQGEAPVHPELLDRLAHELIDHDWDLRAVIRLIVNSRTYRQTSIASKELRKLDPNNRLYARQSSFRLAAEMVRDNALAVSGLLSRDVGGASVKPYQPPGYYRHLNFPQRKYAAHTDSRQWRRGVYVHWQRQFLHPMLKAFDAPSREECTAERPRSNTPLAALTLLNDPTFVEAAVAFAKLTLQYKTDDGTDEQRLIWAFREAVTRIPTKIELGILNKLLVENRQTALTGSPKKSTTKRPSKASPAEIELTAWTAVCRAILNLAETNTRN